MTTAFYENEIVEMVCVDNRKDAVVWDFKKHKVVAVFGDKATFDENRKVATEWLLNECKKAGKPLTYGIHWGV